MIPAMANLQAHASTSPGTTHIIFYHTYMPPKHLLAIEKTTSPGGRSLSTIPKKQGIQVHDMMGPDSSTLKDVRTKSLRISEVASFNKETDEIFLVAPGTIDLSDPTDGLPGWHLHKKFWVHFSFEDSPDWSLADLAKLSLNVYRKD